MQKINRNILFTEKNNWACFMMEIRLTLNDFLVLVVYHYYVVS